VRSENLKAIEEIKALGLQASQAADLAVLEPIRQRVDEILRQHPGDPEVQTAAGDAKRLLLDRATHLTLSSSAPTRPELSPPTIELAPTTIPDPGVIRPVPPPVASRGNMDWRRALWMGVAVGVVLSLILIVVLVNVARRRNVSFSDLTANEVPVRIATVPPGASIRVNGEAKCTSDCAFTLPPGPYQITTFLDGYEPAASGVNLVLGKPETLNLTLEARPQTVRILSDLAQGKVVLDGQPPVDLLDGQYVFERIEPGTHTVAVTGPNAEASFTIDLGPARLPAVSGTVNARNLLAVLVSSFAAHARVVTSSGPWTLAVNGKPEDNASPAGVDLKNFQPGLDEISITQGTDQRSIKEDFGPGPTLTAFLKTDRNVGTLIVSTGENNARVFLNSKEYPRRTQNGQLRIQTIGSVEVRVLKAGFESIPAQTAEVKKGSEVRLEFKMKPQAQTGSLVIEGATPGAEVLIDQSSVGSVADDGSFRSAAVAPGDHVIGLRRDRFVPKQFSRTFAAGQTVTINGADAMLVAERAPAPPPPPAPEPKPVPVAPKPAPPRVVSMDGFESMDGWTQQDNGVWRRRGGGFLMYKTPSAGVFTFALYLVRGGGLFRGGRVRWVMDYTDARNYVVSELDETNLTIRDVVNGRSSDHAKVKHNVDSKDKAWAIQIDVSVEHLIQRIQKGQEWITLDDWNQPGHNFADGKFGFLVQGNDEIGVADFKFVPAR
jgi:PEGA domain-containing protein